MNQSQTINISTSTILRIILILLGLVFLYLIRDVLVIVFLAIVIAAAVNGPATWLQRHKVPRILGVIFIYLVFISVFALMILLILPPLAMEIGGLAAVFPDYIEKMSVIFEEWWGRYKMEGNNLGNLLGQLSGKLSGAASSIFATTVSIFGGLFSALIILVISFYLAVQEKGIKKFLMSITPAEHQLYVSDLVGRIQAKMGGWLRGQFFLGVKYALVLALVAGILELIPYIGPILAAIPAVILAFFQSPFLALLVLILYIVIQQLENNVISPQVMKKAVGLNPIVTIIVMLIGAKLAGILGIILAVPITAAIAEFLRDVRRKEIEI